MLAHRTSQFASIIADPKNLPEPSEDASSAKRSLVSNVFNTNMPPQMVIIEKEFSTLCTLEVITLGRLVPLKLLEMLQLDVPE